MRKLSSFGLMATTACLLGLPLRCHAQTSPDNGQAKTSKRNQQRQDYPPVFEGAREEVYKRVGDIELKLAIFEPRPTSSEDQPLPAIIFFFGGGWKGGNPQQFEQHCRYMAARGIVAITADYRVASRHGVKARDCVEDAKSAIRWLRQHAERLGIDPQRIVAGGGSAGGHLAACTAVVEGFDSKQDLRNISAVPNACALFNPAVVLAPIEGVTESRVFAEEKLRELQDRMGTNPEELSPFHQLSQLDRPCPPMIIFHGVQDTTVQFWTVEVFQQAMQARDTRCELESYEGQGHGFFNYKRGDGTHFVKTVEALDEFLVSLGYLDPTRSIDAEALLRQAVE